mmetsp:Transcript_26128/g.43713  ORF Transcript_26128/g.43713 Transcript_26128/m.43713 type:complete len:181 (-) Transcript_26128:140-682(-)
MLFIGMEFFCTSLDQCNGEFDLMLESLKSMNKDVNPAMLESVGGAGSVGKMLFSAGLERLAILAHVPAEKTDKVSAEKWMQYVCDQTGLDSIVVKGSNETVAMGEVPLNASINAYPLKVKDNAIPHAIAYLKSQGVFPERDDESSDIVYGDDDFPDEDDDADDAIDRTVKDLEKLQAIGS